MTTSARSQSVFGFRHSVFFVIGVRISSFAVSPIRVTCLLDGEAADVYGVESGGAQASLLGQEEVVVAEVEWLDAADGARIFVAHHGCSHGIGGDRVESRNENAG